MAEDEIIKKHTKAVYDTLKAPGMNWKHKAREILLEIVIIVFAVSISIWFHNWSERQKDGKEERGFLTSLKKDLQDDKTEMTADRAGFTQVLQGVNYFRKVGEGLPLSKDSLTKYRWAFFGSAQINPRIGGYEALKGSGRLDIIENRELLKNITDLYQKVFPQIILKNQRFNSLRETYVTPFVEDRLQLDDKGQGLNWQEILRTSKMRMLMDQEAQLSDNIKAYGTGIDKIDEIMQEIDKELK
ncbi:MAG TPA: DUF6090 family protein [Mucilaginibacter sp.]